MTVIAQPGPPPSAAGGTGICATVRAERINDGRSPAMRPWLRARDDIWYNHPDELALLLADCVDPNLVEGEARWTLLHHAAQRDRIAAARVLLAAGANPSLRNREGERPADLARSPEMQALLGPKAALRPAGDAMTPRARECLAKREADAKLCYDSTCRMRTLTKQQRCLKTGLYY